MDDEPKPKRQSTFPLFSKYFTTHPLDVVEYTQNMRKEMEDFIEAFRKRIEIQINYSKSLVQVSKCLDKYIKPGTQLSTSYLCSAFKVEHEQRGRQALELAESIRTEIDLVCSDMLKSHTTTMKKMEKDIRKYYKQAQIYEGSHRSSFLNFQSTNKDTEEMIITKHIMKYTSSISAQKKQKTLSKTLQNVKINKQHEKSYLQSVRNFNQFTEAYNKQIPIQLDQAEKLIREQVILQGDCLRKLIVAEVSMFKNIEYDLLNISKQMEHLDTQKDVEIFVEDKKYCSQKQIISDLKEKEEPTRKNLRDPNTQKNGLQVKKITGKSLLSESIFYVEEQYYNWILSNKKNKKLRQVITKTWKTLRSVQNKSDSIQTSYGEQLSQKIQEITGQLSSPQGFQQKKQQNNSTNETPENNSTWDKQLMEIIQTFKIIQPPSYIVPINNNNVKTPSSQNIYEKFIQITSIITLLWNNQEIDNEIMANKINSLSILMAQHHLYRLIAYIFIEQFRVQRQVIIKSFSHAKTCGRVMKTVINESVKQNDVFIIKEMLGLLFTFYWIDGKSKKLLYQMPQVYQCQIWKKNDFWQAAIFQTTYEQMTIFAPQKGQSQPQIIVRYKSIIFSQFSSFCHYMVLLGNQSKNVCQIVGKFCRLYDMTEDHNKDLSKMIRNTSKQHKQTLQKPSEKIE